MRFLTIAILALLAFGICGFAGGLAMLWLGHLLARVDAFGITTFQGAVICVGFALVSAIIINQLLTSFFSPFSRIRDFPDIEDEEEEEEDDFPVKRVRKQKKRR